MTIRTYEVVYGWPHIVATDEFTSDEWETDESGVMVKKIEPSVSPTGMKVKCETEADRERLWRALVDSARGT